MHSNRNQTKNYTNTLNPPKIRQELKNKNSILANVDSNIETDSRFDKKFSDKTTNVEKKAEPDRLILTQSTQLSQKNFDAHMRPEKANSDEIFIDPFTRWMHKAVGEKCYQ